MRCFGKRSRCWGEDRSSFQWGAGARVVVPGSVWDAARIWLKGIATQQNTRSMNWRICWRWNTLGDPGHDRARPSSVVRYFISPSCLRDFVWIHPSYARATHALVESEGFRNSRFYLHEIRMCGIEEVVKFALGDHAGNAQHRVASLINPSVAELACGGGRWNRIPVGWKFVGPQDKGVIERYGYRDPGYG